MDLILAAAAKHTRLVEDMRVELAPSVDKKWNASTSAGADRAEPPRKGKTKMEKRTQLSFGYNKGVPDGILTAWGCRAVISSDNHIDIVWDRTSVAGPDGDVNLLLECLEAIDRRWQDTASHLLATGQMSARDSREHVLYDDGFLVVKANTNASSGYLYACAYLNPVPTENTATVADIHQNPPRWRDWLRRAVIGGSRYHHARGNS
jgi:hypothetical protein